MNKVPLGSLDIGDEFQLKYKGAWAVVLREEGDRLVYNSKNYPHMHSSRPKTQEVFINKKENEKVEEVKKAYKVLVVEPETGKLTSAIAGRGLGRNFIAQDKTKLTYAEGQITYKPEASERGIYTYRDIELAHRHINEYPTAFVNVEWRIHEVTPLGEGNRPYLGNNNVSTYPAVLLGKEVKRSEPVIKYKFKPGDKVRTLFMGEPYHQVIESIHPAKIPAYNYVGGGWDYEDRLEFDPEPVYEDITDQLVWVNVGGKAVLRDAPGAAGCTVRVVISKRGEIQAHCVEQDECNRWPDKAKGYHMVIQDGEIYVIKETIPTD